MGGQGSVRKARRRADGALHVVKTVDTSRLGPFDRALIKNEAKVRGCFGMSGLRLFAAVCSCLWGCAAA